jgi:hypothetical protein
MLDDCAAPCHNSGQPRNAAAEHFEQPAAHDSERNVMQPALAAPTREQIARLQTAMQAMPQRELPPEHTFGPGFYARTIRIPAGTVLVGREHATEHIFIVSEGEIELVSESGRRRVKAPFQMIAGAGKKLGVAITDVVCTNVHVTAETDFLRLEAQLLVPEALEAPARSEVLS